MDNGPTNGTSGHRSIFDHAPDDKRLAARDENRTRFVTWIEKTLVNGKDYGSIHITKRDNCDLGYKCTPEQRPYHWSKSSLFKPGAEKVLDYFALIPNWPNLEQYEAKVLAGDKIETIVLECQAIDEDGNIYAQGVGAATRPADPGKSFDLNKGLKMAKKSSLVDCALTLGKLSEFFTQDVEDMSPGELSNRPEDEPKFNRDAKIGFGKKHPEEKWRDVDEEYLVWVTRNAKKNPVFQKFAALELEARKSDKDKPPETLANNDSKPGGILVPELEMFLKELSSDKIATLIADRFEAQDLTEIDRAGQLELLEYFQHERPVRMLIMPIGGGPVFGEVFRSHYPDSKYTKMKPEQFDPLKDILAAILRIKQAEKMVETAGVIIRGWGKSKGTTLTEAGIDDLRELEKALGNGQSNIPFD